MSLLLLLGLLVGCTTSAPARKFATKDFEVTVPGNLQQYPARSSFELAFFSDATADTFIASGISIFRYEGYFLEGSIFNQGYCSYVSENLLPRSAATDANLFTGIAVEEVKFVSNEGSPAFCDIQFRLFNRNLKKYENSQLHRQRIFIRNHDEIVVEIATIGNSFSSELLNVLDSFKFL